MLQFWEDYKMFRYLIYAASIVIGSEIGWRWFKYVRAEVLETRGRRKRGAISNSAQEKHLAEVIWTNELTFKCIGNHSKSELSSYDNGDTLSGASQTTCPNPYCFIKNANRLVQLLDNALYSIDVAIYTFTSSVLSKAFLRAIRRGVSLRIISDKEMCYSTGSQILLFHKEGVPVRVPISDYLMHHKFCVIDGASRVRVLTGNNETCENDKAASARGVLLTGSCNWTRQGLNSNWENIAIVSDKQLIEHYELEYERLWNSLAK